MPTSLCLPQDTHRKEDCISAALLNEAMASLGLADIRFDEVDGKPVLRRYCDELSLDRFIGLLLKTIAEVHRQRQAAVNHLTKLDQAIRAQDWGNGSAAALELRRLLSEPVLRQADEAPAARLTIRRDETFLPTGQP